jgi:hypothetical protein
MDAHRSNLDLLEDDAFAELTTEGRDDDDEEWDDELDEDAAIESLL